MKDKLSQELKAIIGTTSLSERTINDYLDNSILPFYPSEEEKQADYLSKHAQVLKSISGQLDHEIASKVNEFKKSYKPTEPQPPKPNVVTPEPNDEIAKKLQEIEAYMTSLKEKETKIEKEKTINNLWSEAKAKLNETGVYEDFVVDLLKNTISIDTNDTPDIISSKVKTLYDEYEKKTNRGGFTPAGGNFSGTNNKKQEEEYRKHLETTGRLIT